MPSGGWHRIDVAPASTSRFSISSLTMRSGIAVVDRQPHDRAELPLAHALLDRLQQVRRLVLLDLHVGIADDPEGVASTIS